MHNYRSNQSALMTRCGTDFRHQYGIFEGESQTSFTRNATRAGSEEGPGGYSIYPWVGRCGADPHTLTLFKTNIADFPTLFKTEFRFFNTLFKTFNPNIN